MGRLRELLDELASRWRAQGNDQEGQYRPGLEPHDIRQALVDADLATPDEIVEWFSWHDGAVGAPTEDLRRSWI